MFASLVLWHAWQCVVSGCSAWPPEGGGSVQNRPTSCHILHLALWEVFLFSIVLASVQLRIGVLVLSFVLVPVGGGGRRVGFMVDVVSKGEVCNDGVCLV